MQAHESGPMEPQQGRTLKIRVRTSEFLNTTAPVVANIHFQIGVCFVEENDWNLSLRQPPQNPLLLVEGVSDADGVYFTETFVPASWLHTTDGRKPVLWGRVVEDGYIQSYRKRKFPEDGTQTFDFPIQAREGTTIRGKVLRKDGTPAQGAEVTYVEFSERKNLLLKESGTQTNDAGQFEIHLGMVDSFTLLAELGGGGNAWVVDAPLSTTDPAQDILLRLRGDGVLAGRILDPAGNPARHDSIRAIPAYPPEDWDTHRSSVIAPHRLSDEGLASAYGTTDNDGYFRFEGLQRGAYQIVGRTPANYFRQRLTQDPVSTGEENLLLQRKGYRLLLRVLDDQGQVVHPELMHSRSQWTKHHALFLERCDENGVIDHTTYHPEIHRVWSENGETVFTVEPGKSYAFGVISAASPLLEQTITIDSDHYETFRTVQLAPPKDPSYIKLLVQSDRGEIVPPYLNRSISSLESGVVLLEGGLSFDLDATLESAIAAGDYLLKADGKFAMNLSGGLNWVDWNPAERVLHVNPGEHIEPILILAGGGRFRVSVRAVGQPDVPSKFELWSLDTDNNFKATHYDGVHFRLTSMATGETIEPTFLLPMPSYMTHHYDYGDWVRNGDTESAYDLLAPGEYMLRAQMDGYPVVEQLIQIAYGETTVVQVVLKGPIK